MAFQQPFKVPQFDVELPKSYWKLVAFRIDIVNKHGTLVFAGFKDEATRRADPNKSFVRIEVEISPKDFDVYFATTGDFVAAAHAYARNGEGAKVVGQPNKVEVKTVKLADGSTREERIETELPRISPFAAAIDV